MPTASKAQFESELDEELESRVTTKKMKFEARKLKFCTWGLVGRPDLKIEKKKFEKFHAYAKCRILISQNSVPQICSKVVRRRRI